MPLPTAISAGFDRFRRAIGLEHKSNLASPEAGLLELFGAVPAASGIAVTPRNAMQCAAVRCAVQAIAEAIGQLPVHVYERRDGGKARAPGHPAYGLLHDEANPWTPASDLREQLTRDALLWGNGYGFIVHVAGKPVEIHRLDPDRVTVSATATGEPQYKVKDADGSERTYPASHILHIRAPSVNGIAGNSPVAMAREAIALAIVMEQHAARLFGNGARPSGIIAFKGHLTPEGLTKAKAAWQAAHGAGKSGGTAVMDGEAAFHALTLTSVDTQFLELRKFAVEEIARVFRVPPVLLMDYGRATWSNAETVGQQFLTFTLMTWIKRWEGECRLKLFTPDERKALVVEFLLDDLLRADFATRMEGYSKAIAARILNPNEAQAAENRAPYEGGETFANPHVTAGAKP